jgi:hypothetical protein
MEFRFLKSGQIAFYKASQAYRSGRRSARWNYRPLS